MQTDSVEGKDLDTSHTVLMKEFAISIGKKEPNSGYVMQQMSNLVLEGYLEMRQNKGKTDMEVSITGKGISAVMSETFKIKHEELLGKAVMNIALTVANVAVAIVAIISLTKDNGELQKIEDRVSKLEKAQHIEQVTANPNILHLQSSNQSSTKQH